MKESEIRDFIVSNFSPFDKYIINYSQFERELVNQQANIKNGYTNSSKVLISDLIKLIVIDKLLQALPLVKELHLIDKEFTVLRTDSGRGKQPAIDIMAYNKENYCLALLELKISDSAEREAVTELSAYNQGLQNKYRGLSSLEVLWMPISTHWRTTTKSAIEFQLFWKDTLILPLTMEVDYNTVKNKVNNIELSCFNPINDLTEIQSLNIFSYECFEAFDYCTMENIPDKNAFISYVTALCSRKNINGFIIFHKPVNLMFPYGFTLCIYNPYKGYLHEKLSIDFIDKYGEAEYFKCYKKSGIINTEFSDVDFKSGEVKHWDFSEDDMEGKSLRWDAQWEKDFLSVGEFGEQPENSNISFLFKNIRKAIDSNGKNHSAIGFPDFEALFASLDDKLVDSITYLGIYQELISKKILVEHQRDLHQEDFFSSSSSLPYLRQTLKEYNQK